MIWVLFVGQALAGERFFAWSYGADTLPKGGIEVEHYATVETHHEAGELVPDWTHQIELEYGITAALEGGLYVVAKQEGDEALRFAGYKGRLRYRFWPIGTKPVDLAAYLEYVGSPSFDEHGIEAKVIVAKEGAKWRSSLNLTGELELAGDEVETILEPTLGLAWRATPHVALGLEGKLETVFVKPVEGPFAWAGPTIHLAGDGGRLWWSLSAIGGLTGPTREDAEIEARSLIGINL